MSQLVLVNDREIAIQGNEGAQIREVEPGLFSVLWEGKSFQVRIATDRTAFSVDIMGVRFRTEARDPRNVRPRSGAMVRGGPQTVRASMPGKVIRVLVEPGQEIDAGQGLIVVEAMKMQNELKSAKPGRVVQVHTKDGYTVAAGDALITIE